MRRAARKDVNHNEIAKVFARLGYYVCDTSRVGSGFPDMIIDNERTFAYIEAKVGKAKLTEDEKTFQQLHLRRYHVIRSPEDALKLHDWLTKPQCS